MLRIYEGDLPNNVSLRATHYRKNVGQTNFNFITRELTPAKRGDNVLTLCVCYFVCVYVFHDVCPDELTMNDCCLTNNSLQARSWWCLVVQVMFHTLMTSSMASAGRKAGQILKLLYLYQYFS